MEQVETKQDGVQSYIIYPTLTSSINVMDYSYHPKLTLGAISGDRDLKEYLNYNYENRKNILLNMNEFLDKPLQEVSFEQVAEHFVSKTRKLEAINEDIIHVNDLIANHRSRQTEKLKLKMSPAPMPSSGNNNDEEIKRKKALALNPFRIPNPLAN